MARRTARWSALATVMALGSGLAGSTPALAAANPPRALSASSPTAVAEAGRGPAGDPSEGGGVDRPALADVPAPPPPAPDAAPAQLLVRFADRATATQRTSALAAHGTVAAGVVEDTGFVTVPVGEQDAEALRAELARDPRVEQVQVDGQRSVAGWPDDPLLDYDWQSHELLRLPEAWDVSQGSGVVIAVLDTGVDPDQEDLVGAVLPGWDVVNGDGDPMDDNGHGTAVAAVAAARADNAIGDAGTAWKAKVLPVKVLDADGRGFDSGVATGIAWAVDHGADVINLSLAGPGASPVILAGIRSAVGAGVVVVVAAGNGGSEVPQYPAAYAPAVAGMVSVSATTEAGTLAGFSTWGDTVSLAAPGYGIVAPNILRGGYAAWSGTSFSAPFVSGIVALRLAGAAGTPAQVEEALLAAARDAGPRGVDPYFGRGIADAAAAVGLGSAPALDRAAGDAGAEDGQQALAQPIGGSGIGAPATLSPEGDVDWYRYEAVRARYQVTLTVIDTADAVQPTGPDTAGIVHSGINPALEVRDSAGRVLATRDVNGPGQDETVAVATAVAGPLSVGVSNTDGTASGQRYRVSVSKLTTSPFTVEDVQETAGAGPLCIGDLTGDAVPDALLVPAASGSVRLRPGVGDGTFGAAAPVSLGATSSTVPGLACLDVEGDGDLDAVVSTSDGFIQLRRSAGGLVAGPPTTVPGGGQGMTAADVDADGDTDLVVTGANPATTAVYVNTGGTFARGADLGAAYPAVAVADLTQDDRVDIVSSTGAVHAQQADGTFLPVATLPTGGAGATFGVAVGDVTGDAIADVVRTAPLGTSTEGVLVTPGLAGGTFGSTLPYGAGATPGPVAIADVDHDGRLDVVVAGGDGKISVLWQGSGGALSGREVTQSHATVSTYDPYGLVVSDLDASGDVDVVLAGQSQLHSFIAPTGPAAWFTDASPAPHAEALSLRPTVALTSGRSLDATSVTAQSVRLVDGTTGADVTTVARAYDPGTGVVSLTSTADLTAGRPYEVLVTGLRDAGGAVQTVTARTWFIPGISVTRVEPPSGGTQGGTPVVLVGTGLSGATQVTFGGVPGTALHVTSSHQLTVTTPPGASGPVPVVVTTATGSSAASSSARFTYVTFVAQTPTRVLSNLTVTPGAVRCVQIAGRAGVPAQATGVVMNVTTVKPTGLGNVVVYPDTSGNGATPAPTGSTVNFETRADVANSAFVALPSDGKVCYATQGATSVGILMDVAGYTLPGSGVTMQASRRLLDTRAGTFHVGSVTGPVEPRHEYTVQVTGGASGVPAGAAAVLLNVTVTGVKARGHLRVYPGGTSLPGTSTVNYAPGRDKANGTMVALSASGQISFYSDTLNGTATNPVQVIIDVVGYVAAGASVTGVSPTRVMDTRSGAGQTGPVTGPVAPRWVHSLPLTGEVPAGATAVLLNVTAIGPTSPGHLRVYPDTAGTGATAPPDVSSINYIVGRDIPNLVVVALPADGRVDFYSDQSGGTVQLAADVVGYVTAGG